MVPAAGAGAKDANGSPQTIDRYQIGALIGRGGMAEVYRGKLMGLGGFERDVAVKVLLPQLSVEPEFVNMLLDEARIAGTINHGNVVQVLDVGQDGAVFYLVMEYVDGTDLRSIEKRHERGQVPVEPLLYIIAEVLRGLEAIHTARDAQGNLRRIVHRDVTPSNVLLTATGFVKLADFGIAHATGRLTQTRHGAVKGKTRYMAPEQLDGKPIDQRTDLFAVGVLLLEALLGRDAADAWHATAMGPIFKIPWRPPPGLPRDLAVILARALAGSPGERYQGAADFRRDVLRALHARSLERGDLLSFSADQLQEFLRPLLAQPEGQTVALRRPSSASGRASVLVEDTSDPSQRPVITSGILPTPPAPPSGMLSVEPSPRSTSSPLPLLSAEGDVATAAAGPPQSTQTLPLQTVVPTQATVTLPVLAGSPPPFGAPEATVPAGPPPAGLQTLADEDAQATTAVTSALRPLEEARTLPPMGQSTYGHVPELRPGLRQTLTQVQRSISTVLRPGGEALSLKLLGMVLAGLLLGVIGVIAVYQTRGLRPAPAAPPRVVEAPPPPVLAPPPLPRTGHLEVLSPPATRVMIDGVARPELAPHSYELAPGTHRVKLSPPKRREVTRTVEIEAGKVEQLRL